MLLLGQPPGQTALFCPCDLFAASYRLCGGLGLKCNKSPVFVDLFAVVHTGVHV